LKSDKLKDLIPEGEKKTDGVKLQDWVHSSGSGLEIFIDMIRKKFDYID